MLFTRAGANLSMLRLHVGSSDYSASIYSYDEVPGDVEMKHFSIDHDRKEVIPMVREALAVRPDLFVFSSPWSPPGWMKTNGGPFGLAAAPPPLSSGLAHPLPRRSAHLLRHPRLPGASCPVLPGPLLSVSGRHPLVMRAPGLSALACV